MGFLLPALMAVFTAVNVFHCAPWFAVLCAPPSQNPFADLTYVALVVWVLAVLLLSLNYFAYRLLEGYLPPVSWLTLLKEWHKRRFRRLSAERERLRAAGKKGEGSNIRFALLNTYPSNEDEFLPTLFGNTIRAFEVYSRDMYGADSISIWERLEAVIPSSYEQLISDAHAQADFFVNTCLLAFIIACAAAVKLIAEYGWTGFTAAPADSAELVTTIVVALVVAATAYGWSIGRLVAWGNLVKGAFDCYLPALAAQLGYVLPPSEAKRREFWTDVSKLALYRVPLKERKWKLASEPPHASKAGGGGDSGDDSASGD